MSSTPPWLQIADLFESTDGSLPDLYVDGLSAAKVVDVYCWVMSQCFMHGDPHVWHVAQSRDIPLSAIPAPAQAFVNGEIETFRHGLDGLKSNGYDLPFLTISLDTPTCVSFDYRTGSDWNEQTINAFLSFVANIRKQAPNARIWLTEEGMWDRPNADFTKALAQYEAEMPNP